MDELIKMYEGDEVVKHWHEQADFKVRRQKRPDYYAILGVSSVASEPEIKAAYKQKALITHPDKHADSDEATRKTAEEEFKKKLEDMMKKQAEEEAKKKAEEEAKKKQEEE